MKKIIISFGGTERGTNRHNTSYGIHRDYTAEVRRLFRSAEPYGFDGYWEYNNDWIERSAYWQTDARRVLEQPSFGWAFKSICVYDALSMMDGGDVVLWMDSNDVLIDNPQPLLNFAVENGLYSHDHYPTYYPNGDWTHKDTFVGMNCDSEKYWRTPQFQVNIMAFCKRPEIMKFVEEWVQYSTDYDVIISNVLSNPPTFQEHRHEQSIFSILMAKYNFFTTRGYPHFCAEEKMGIDQ